MPNNNKKNVKIQAKQVVISEKKTRNSRNRNKRRRSGGNSERRRDGTGSGSDKLQHLIEEMQPPRGIQTGVSGLGGRIEAIRERVHADLTACDELGEQAKQAFLLHADPCGELSTTLAAAQMTDGALDTSAPAFARLIETIVFPFQDPSSTDLSGKTYSIVFLQFPFFRSMVIVIVKQQDGELTTAEKADFLHAWNNILNRANVTYPSWYLFGTGLYFTTLQTEALQNIEPPDAAGNSGLIDAFRFTSQGLNVLFNTPDLLDQGTYVCHRYPCDTDVKALTSTNLVPGAEVEYLHSGWTSVPGVPAGVTFLITINVDDAGDTLTPTFPSVIALPTTSFPTTSVSATDAYRNSSGTFNVSVGNLVQYRIVANVVQLFNITNSQALAILTIPATSPIGISSSNTVRLYRTAGPTADDVYDSDFNTVTLPPISQSDILQQNPKAVCSLLKETGGFYIPSRIMQPVFNLTLASSYRKLLLIAKQVDLESVDLDPRVGWFDTIDHNYSVAIGACLGVPYACKPMIKANRGLELVPAANSIVGLFTTGAPPAQPEIVEMCKSFDEAQPQGYPSNYNSLGILGGKALNVIESIPNALRFGLNIARTIKRVCDEERMDSKSDPIEEMMAQGFKRLLAAR